MQSQHGVGGCRRPAAVELRAGRARRPQRGVVGREPLAVAEHSARDAERAHRDDGDRRSSTGGICHARVISHAETPASASALPSDEHAEWRPPAAVGRTPGRSSEWPQSSGSTAARKRRQPSTRTIAITDRRAPESRWPTTTTVAPARARATMASSTRASESGPDAPSARRAAGPAPTNQRAGQRQVAGAGRATARCRRARSRCPGRRAASAARYRNPSRHAVVEVVERTEELEVLAQRPGISTGRCGSQATWRHHAGGRVRRDVTSRRSRPGRTSGGVSPRIACMAVLLPAPLGPVSTVTVPGVDVDRERRAVRCRHGRRR